jgi:signal transduction histidine kinase
VNLRGDELSRVFVAELHDRVTWFLGARWAVAAGVLFFAAIAPTLGFPEEWRRTWLLAVLICLYNFVFHVALANQEGKEGEPQGRWLARCAFLQIVLDLLTLLAFVALTGAAWSPFTVFFVFHMAIGTIMLSARIMLILAAGVWVACAVLFLAPPAWAEQSAFGRGVLDPIAELGVLAAALFFTVYLTGTVVARYKDRGVQLFQLSGALREKTAALEAILAELRRVEERKSKFMLLSAHQLRSPLGTVKTSLEVLRQGYVECGSPRGRRLLDGASERVDGLLAIVSDLLDLAKLREGDRRAPWADNVNLKQLVKDLLDALEPYAQGRGVAFRPELSSAVLSRGIPPDLVYAIENLIQNAVKYSHPGSEIEIGLTVVDGDAEIVVHDHGIGIPPEYLEDVFVEFVRAPNAKSYTAEGTGLGLAIVREVAAKHGGTVGVRSELGAGSVFSMRLPLITDRASVTKT